MKNAKYIKRITIPSKVDGEADREIFYSVESPWNTQTEETIKRRAYNGEYTIEDDGQPEPTPSTESILLEIAADHEARLCEIELGV